MGWVDRCESIFSSLRGSLTDRDLKTMIDRKLEPLVKRLMIKYLGEMEEEDLIMFVLEHLKDHKGPAKLVEGLEPVRRLYAVNPSIAVLISIFFARCSKKKLLNSQ